jgi:hypothetical protein
MATSGGNGVGLGVCVGRSVAVGVRGGGVAVRGGGVTVGEAVLMAMGVGVDVSGDSAAPRAGGAQAEAAMSTQSSDASRSSHLTTVFSSSEC